MTLKSEMVRNDPILKIHRESERERDNLSCHTDLYHYPFKSRGLVVIASTSPTKRLAFDTDISGDAH